DFDLTITTTTQEFDDDNPGTTITSPNPNTASTSNTLHFEIQGVAGKAVASMSAGSDRGVTVVDDENPGTGTEQVLLYTDNVMHRQLDFNYTAETQDRGDGSNNSESITRIVLDKGAFPGSWDYPTVGGDYGLIIKGRDADGNFYDITETDAVVGIYYDPLSDQFLTLTFSNPEVEYVDLNQVLAIRMLAGQQTPFNLKITTTTAEWDDEGTAIAPVSEEQTDNTLYFDFQMPIEGDAGANVLVGTAGDDGFIGRGDNDTITGGQGDDTFLYQTAGDLFTPSDGHDHITDFSTVLGNNDIINLDALFDSLGIASADREIEATYDGVATETTLQVGTRDGVGVFTDATGGDFSVTLDGLNLNNADVDDLIANGNIYISDES
ncbi:MAG: type I secretion C-terminal target domain-containing protein, partial [Sedimenticola sp.]